MRLRHVRRAQPRLACCLKRRSCVAKRQERRGEIRLRRRIHRHLRLTEAEHVCHFAVPAYCRKADAEMQAGPEIVGRQRVGAGKKVQRLGWRFLS